MNYIVYRVCENADNFFSSYLAKSFHACRISNEEENGQINMR